jgi:hypothetical protein
VIEGRPAPRRASIPAEWRRPLRALRRTRFEWAKRPESYDRDIRSLRGQRICDDFPRPVKSIEGDSSRSRIHGSAERATRTAPHGGSSSRMPTRTSVVYSSSKAHIKTPSSRHGQLARECQVKATPGSKFLACANVCVLTAPRITERLSGERAAALLDVCEQSDPTRG